MGNSSLYCGYEVAQPCIGRFTMNKPTFSIIVPVYNVEKYLKKCVDSILNQSFSDFELILIDDGSPDSSGAICDAYAANDSRVRVIHKLNGGVSSARNAGLQQAVGKYVVFCDGDDSLLNHYLEKMYNILQPGIHLAICGFESVDEQGNPIQGRRSNDCSLDSLPRYLDNDLFWKLFKGKRISSCYDKAFRMDLIRQYGLEFPLNVSMAEDTDFVLRYLMAAENGCAVTVTDERLYMYLTVEHDSAVQKLRTNQWQLFERLFPMLEQYVSNNGHREALREYICSTVWFVMDGLLRYDNLISFNQFRIYVLDMLISKYFQEVVGTPTIRRYNRVMVAFLESRSAVAVWCFYLLWKVKCFLRKK